MSFLRFFIIVCLGTKILSAQPSPDYSISSGFHFRKDALGEVVSVSVTGTSGHYNFSVGISSPDTGCDQYANWWEVITPDGKLIYRRILLHSHVNEQPFTRSGRVVQINADTEVIVRMHMNTTGYSSKVFKGSINAGFESITVDSEFAKHLEYKRPLPERCAF